MSMRVLLVENNDLQQSKSLLPQLQRQGHQVAVAHSLETALETVKNLWPNVIIFSPSNSQLQFVDFQRSLHQTKLNIPCLVVDNKQEIISQEGDPAVIAAEYPLQLNQGIEEVTLQQKNRFIRFTDLIIDCYEQRVLRQQERHSLTPKEFKLLHLFISHPDEVLSRKKIMQSVWETDYMGDTRTLDVHIRWLREKIEANPSQPKRLITVRGVGYRFMAEEVH